jgi:hypothetical protein
MSSLNFIGGEKGGVGKSVVARVLAQYFIDRELPFTGFDTDRSHATFSRFYGDYASPVVVDTYQGLDQIASVFDPSSDLGGDPQSVIVDLAAQTAAPLSHWVHDSELLPLMLELGVQVNWWHVADAGKDSVDLLGNLIDTYGASVHYVVVKNLGRGKDFSSLEHSTAFENALAMGSTVLELELLHEASMRKMDRQNTSFWAAAHNHNGPDALGMLERQRVKRWLKHTYTQLDAMAQLRGCQ